MVLLALLLEPACLLYSRSVMEGAAAECARALANPTESLVDGETQRCRMAAEAGRKPQDPIVRAAAAARADRYRRPEAAVVEILDEG